MSATDNQSGTGLRREAPPVAIVIAVLLLVCGVGAGIFYLLNNGWQTQSQRDYNFYHDYLPLLSLEHGDRKAFDDENALRKKEGRPPLVAVKGPPKLTGAQDEAARQVLLRAYAAKNGKKTAP